MEGHLKLPRQLWIEKSWKKVEKSWKKLKKVEKKLKKVEKGYDFLI